MNGIYALPEGSLIDTPENSRALARLESILDAMRTEKTVEGMVISCGKTHDLCVNMGGIRAYLPRAEAALGIDTGQTREIAVITRVGKPVACKITDVKQDNGRVTGLTLSRRLVQEEAMENYVSKLSPGDVIPVRVTRVERFGIFVDVGCGINSFISLENISVSRIPYPAERFSSGDDIPAIVTRVESDTGRIFLSHKELLGTWTQNAEKFSAGQTVIGIVRSIESYGIFVELTPNLSGLAEPCDGYKVGEHVSVYIKNILPESMKIKLVIIDRASSCDMPHEYYISSGRIERWDYSPPECTIKRISRIFSLEE